jgi:hypothetical protein
MNKKLINYNELINTEDNKYGDLVKKQIYINKFKENSENEDIGLEMSD